MVRVAQNPWPYFTVWSETASTWRTRFPYLYPPATVWPSHTSGHWFPLRRLLRLARLRWRYSNRLQTWRARSSVYIPQEQDGPVQSGSQMSKSRYDRRQSISTSRCLAHAALEGLHQNECLFDIRRGTLRWSVLLPLGGLHVKHSMQRGIWVSTQHLPWDQGKPRKTFIELSGRRTFRMQTDF
jgi:hypothetical protein